MKKFEHFKANLKVLVRAENEDLSNEFIIGGIIDKFFVQFELAARRLVGVILKEYIPAFVKMQEGIETYYGAEIEDI